MVSLPILPVVSDPFLPPTVESAQEPPAINSLPFPAHVNFDVTYRCNANCSFCYVIDRSSTPVRIDLNQAEQILAILAQCGVMRVNFFGGEPLLVRSLDHLIRTAKRLDLRTTLITNGLLLTHDFCAAVAGYLDLIAVSVHGMDEDHDAILGVPSAFDRVLKRLDWLSQFQIDFGINYTVLEGSGTSFEPLARSLLARFPIKFFAANRFVGGHGKDDVLLAPTVDTLNKILESFERLEHDYPDVGYSYAIYFPLCLVRNPAHRRYMSACGVGTTFCSVDFDGNIRMCSYSDKVLGNVLKQNPLQTWQDNSVLKAYRSGDWVPDVCRTCELFDSCLGGCRVSDHKRVFGPDVLLQLHPLRDNSI